MDLKGLIENCKQEIVKDVKVVKDGLDMTIEFSAKLLEKLSGGTDAHIHHDDEEDANK